MLSPPAYHRAEVVSLSGPSSRYLFAFFSNVVQRCFQSLFTETHFCTLYLLIAHPCHYRTPSIYLINIRTDLLVKLQHCFAVLVGNSLSSPLHPLAPLLCPLLCMYSTANFKEDIKSCVLFYDRANVSVHRSGGWLPTALRPERSIEIFNAFPSLVHGCTLGIGEHVAFSFLHVAFFTILGGPRARP